MAVMRLVVVLCLGLATNPVVAGIYTDELTKCIVETTTKEDRVVLMKWMFAAMSANPAIAPLSKVTPEDREASNKLVGSLFMKVLTDTCKDKTQKALNYEGPAAIQQSFQVLGQVAAGDIFSSPEVAQVMSGLEKYVDNAKIQALATQPAN